MKIKAVVSISMFFFLINYNSSLYAKQYNYQLPKTPKYGSTYDKTHNVRSYFKKDGTFIQKHRAGNPNSGVHCHKNVCY